MVTAQRVVRELANGPVPACAEVQSCPDYPRGVSAASKGMASSNGQLPFGLCVRGREVTGGLSVAISFHRTAGRAGRDGTQ